LTEHATTECLLFPDIFDRPVVAKFDQGQGSSDGGAVLIDLGVSTAATLSSGKKLPGPKPLQAHLERLQRLSRWHSWKKKGSNNRRKSAMRLARLHARISNVRQDWLHQTSTRLVHEFSVIGIEDLNVRGLMATEKLARNIADIGFHEFRRQLEYKARLYGTDLVTASRWFPSSKICSACGRISEQLPLSIREWACECGMRPASNPERRRAARDACPFFAWKPAYIPPAVPGTCSWAVTMTQHAPKTLASRSFPVASGLGSLKVRFNFFQRFAFRLWQKQRRGKKIDHRASREGEEHGAVAKLPYGWQKHRRNSR